MGDSLESHKQAFTGGLTVLPQREEEKIRTIVIATDCPAVRKVSLDLTNPIYQGVRES